MATEDKSDSFGDSIICPGDTDEPSNIAPTAKIEIVVSREFDYSTNELQKANIIAAVDGSKRSGHA